MKTLWITLAVVILSFIIFWIINSISCWIHKEKYKYVLFDKILDWKIIKNVYNEIFKASFYLIIVSAILIFLGYVLIGYWNTLKVGNNFTESLRYFLPQKDTINLNCLTLNADSFYFVKPNKDTFNLTKCNQVPQDTAKRMVFIINGNNKYGGTGSISNPKTNNTETIVSKKSDAENPKDKILEDTSNIIGHTSNLLTYITIFFAIIGIFGGIGIYKYVTTINNLKKETERLKNKTLDAGLVTISAVPLVEATQITSDEYNPAIETITNSIVENRDNINENPKYSRLLIVKALHYWNLRDYGHAAHILKDALKLAYRGVKDDTVKTINYHLARVYKQWGYEELIGKNKKTEEYFDESKDYAKNTFPEQEKVINLSIASIKYNENNNDENKNDLIKTLYYCLNEDKKPITVEEATKYIKQIKKNDIGISDFASWTAFTVIALLNKEEKFVADYEVAPYCADKSLLFFEDKIFGQEGANIKASWYETMVKLLDEIKEKENEYKRERYATLSKFYQDQLKEKNNNFKLFHPVLLIEK